MSAVSVGWNTTSTCDYWFQSVAVQGTGTGSTEGGVVHGRQYGAGSVSTTLDDSITWDLRIDFQNAPPVIFHGLNVSGGGDLFTLLAAQGWSSL